MFQSLAGRRPRHRSLEDAPGSHHCHLDDGAGRRASCRTALERGPREGQKECRPPAKAQGFRAERQSRIVIQIGQLAQINFSLVVGNVVETVEVTGAAPLLRTENATLGGVVAPERIVNLPLNGRSFVQLSILTPGVRTSEPSQFTASTGGSGIIPNGARDAWIQVNIDGITMVDNRRNYVDLLSVEERLEEF